MTLVRQIKPISYLDSNAADIVKEFATNPKPLIITQNGETKVAVMEINQYESRQEQLALLRLIALGRNELKAGVTLLLRPSSMKWTSRDDPKGDHSECRQAQLSRNQGACEVSVW
jgi:prevent-host-death family protein